MGSCCGTSADAKAAFAAAADGEATAGARLFQRIESLCARLESWPALVASGVALVASFILNGHGCHAHGGGALKGLTLGECHHFCAQTLYRLADIAAKHALCLADQGGVVLLAHRARADADATPHLKIETGTLLADVARKPTLAGGQGEGAVDRLKSGVCPRGSLVGSVVFSLARRAVARDAQSGIGPLLDLDIGIGFCIL